MYGDLAFKTRGPDPLIEAAQRPKKAHAEDGHERSGALPPLKQPKSRAKKYDGVAAIAWSGAPSLLVGDRQPKPPAVGRPFFAASFSPATRWVREA
jgi:hypothetical protein